MEDALLLLSTGKIESSVSW